MYTVFKRCMLPLRLTGEARICTKLLNHQLCVRSQVKCSHTATQLVRRSFTRSYVVYLKALESECKISGENVAFSRNWRVCSKSFFNLQQLKGRFDAFALFFSSMDNKDNKSDSSKSSQPDQQDNPNFNESNMINLLLLSCFILGAFYLLGPNGDPIPEVTWNTFYREMLTKGEVERLDVGPTGDLIYVYIHRGGIVGGKEVRPFGPHYLVRVSSAENFEEKLSIAYKELGISSENYLPVNYRVENELMGAFVSALSSIFIFGVLWYMFFYRKSAGSRNLFGSNPFQDRGKAKATIIEAGGNNGIRLKDVGGMGEAKEEVLEFVDYLKSPNRYKDLGAKIPKGALLVGPPGTGKTLLVKAIATEAKVPFLSMAGPEFVELFSGIGSARVRDLFRQAKQLAPCIVFIDELDSIGRSRRSSGLTGGENEQENTLIQLLVEMDVNVGELGVDRRSPAHILRKMSPGQEYIDRTGMNSIDGVIMLASTNRADILDQALLRPGRFDRLINIDLPTLSERKDILKVHLSKLKLERKIEDYVRRLAEFTPGYSGADLANVCNEAALHAVRLNEQSVDTNNFDYAVERIIAGMEKKTNSMSSVEREMLAYHEAGHAVVGWMLQHVDPLLKVSIVPRTNATLGYSQYLPSDQKLYTTEQLFDRMCMSLGGRIAESKIFRKVTTGAEDDLKKVTDIAYKQISMYGMNDRVGNISLPIKKPSELGKRPYSDKLSRLIDEEVRLLISQCYQRTESLIDKHLEDLRKVAQALLKHEVLNYDEIEALIGKRPYKDSLSVEFKVS